MSARSDKQHILIFACITALCLVGDSMLYIVLPVHYQSVGLTSLWQVGVILAVNRIVRLPLNPCIGYIYKHISERTGILIAVGLAVITTFSYGLIDSFLWWIIARCLWGLAWTLLRLGSLFCIFKVSTPVNRGQLTGLYNGTYRLGSLVGMLAGGILADTIGVALTAIIFGSLGLLAFLLTLRYIPVSVPEPQIQGTGMSLKEGFILMRQHPSILWLVLTGASIALAIQGVLAATISRLIENHSQGTLVIFGITAGAASMAGLFQALRWGWEPWLAPWFGKLTDKYFGWRRMFIVALLTAASFFILVSLPLPLGLWFGCLFGLQLTATALTTVSETAASDSACNVGGRSLLMYYALIVDVGAAFGPLIAYALNGVFGINAVYLFCGFLFILLGIIWSGRTKWLPKSA